MRHRQAIRRPIFVLAGAVFTACAADSGDTPKPDAGVLNLSVNTSGSSSTPSGGSAPASTTASSDSAPTENGAANSSTSGTGASSLSTSTNAGASSSSAKAGGSSSSSKSASDSGASTVVDASTDSGIAACPSGLQDKITTCGASDLQQCVKGCGPDLPATSSQSNLGTKVCTCTSGVYQCAACVYINPLPACYVESSSASACASGVADKAACTKPCPPSTGNDVCTILSDAGKSEGCVCITGSSGDVWTCATLPW